MATVECPSCRTSNPSEALYCSACGAAMHRSDGDDMIGLTVGGRYHLVEKIGQGSAGTLYRAEHVTLRRRMAVKLLHKQLALSDEAVERFRREAITVCEIDNDHIPQVHDFGRTEDEQLFFAMEFLDGETLSSVLERDGRVSPERAADILSQIADGLMEAHTLGYVHRDLRPRSIFLTRRRGRQDFVKILDFGLAKLVQPEIDAQRTAMGMTYGDPRYMAPEQARGEPTDRRADIYSLGVLGFEMLVGEPPFKGGGTFEVLQKVLDAPVPRVRERRADCPPWLESVIRTALAKRPADRFQTVAQLLDALERKQVLANQPPMPMQLTSQQASKLAGMKEAPAAPPRTGPAAQMQVFVSSPSLRAIPLATGAATPAPSSTQAMPTVATGPRTTFPGQGPGRLHQPAAEVPAAPSPAPRMTMSYPAVKLSRSGTAPGVSEPRPAPEPPALTGQPKPGASSELRLLGERMPPGAAKSAPGGAAAAKSTPAAPPAGRAAESLAKPSILIASTTQPRNDPTPRTARAMLEQEAMAWEEAAQPVLSTADLTDSANMSEPTGRAPSADTPVEEMKFAPGAASAASPPAEVSAVAPRPISAPAIAAMRSMFPGPGGPKASEPQKAQAAAASAGEKSPGASASGTGISPVGAGKSASGFSASVPAASKSASGLSASVPAASKSASGFSASVPAASKSASGLGASVPGASRSSSGLSASVPGVSKSAAGVSASVPAVDKSAAEVSASTSGVSRLAGAAKAGDRPEAVRPAAAAIVPTEAPAESTRVTAPLPRPADPVTAAPAATPQPALGKSSVPAAAPVEQAPFAAGSRSLADTEDDSESADATIPHIRSSRDDETPIIGHNPTSARSPAAPAPPADDVETAAMAKATGEQAVNLPHDTPKDGVPAGRATGAESNWFSTPAASAADTFAADDSEVVIGRRRVPKWALAVAAGGVLLLGIVYVASRPSPPPAVVPPQPAAVSSPAAVVVPPPVVPPAVPPAPAAPTPEVAKTEPAAPAPEVTPLPVATPVPSSAPVKPVPGAEASPGPAEAKLGTDKPVVTAEPTAPPAKAPKPAAVAANPVTPPEARSSEKPEPKTKSASAKSTAENKANPAADPAKAEPEHKVAAKAPKEPKEPKAAPEAVAAVDKPAKKPGEAGALVQNARKKLEDGEPDAAAALFSRAVELDPKNAEALGGLGESYFEQGNFEAAARNLGKASRLAPRRASYQELLVQALYKVNRFKDAADACHKLLKLDPGSAKAKQILDLAEKKLGAASK